MVRLNILRVWIGIFITLFLYLAYSIIITIFADEIAMDKMRGYSPQAIETFELSREKLELLTNGEFAKNNASVLYTTIGLSLAFEGSSPSWYTAYDQWDTIEWLSDAERDAILFLTSSEELPRNFVEIDTTHATLYKWGSGPSTDILAIYYPGVNIRESSLLWQDSFSVNLGGGYILRGYQIRGPGMHTAVHNFVNTIIVIFAVIVLIIIYKLMKKLKIAQKEHKRELAKVKKNEQTKTKKKRTKRK